MLAFPCLHVSMFFLAIALPGKPVTTLLPACLQFVNYTELQSRIGHLPQEQAEAKFALACLMEVPEQYKVALAFCWLIGWMTAQDSLK